MQELIKIERNENMGIETINARELHEFLGSKRQFGNWIKQRIESYGFVEGEDFITNLLKSNGGRPSIDYFISIDMAKELSMVENNEKGKAARRYFIQKEKEAKTLSTPKSYSEALLVAYNLAKDNERLKEIQLIQEPKARVYDTIIDSRDLLSMDKVAKILNAGMGRNNLFRELRKRKILMDSNVPYQQYMNRGYFEVKEKHYDVNGETRIAKTTLVTQKGLVYLQKILA